MHARKTGSKRVVRKDARGVRAARASRVRRASSRIPPLLPRNPRERHRIEYLGATTTTMFLLLIGCVFLGTGYQHVLLGRPNVAAVVSSVLVDLANGDRIANSLSTLRVNPVLVAAAQAKADDMARKGYFAHTSPEGLDPWHWFGVAGYSYDYAGENLAVDFSDSGDVERAWMNSPTHRKNILDAHYTEIGIAMAQGMYEGRMTTFVVQEFGTPATGASTPSPSITTEPHEPTEIATAVPAQPIPASKPHVLGTTAADKALIVPQKTKATPPTPVSPPREAPVAEHTAPSWWGYILSFPRDTMRYAFYLIGFLIVAALVLETGLEIRWHHRRHALRAGLLLGVMVLLFTVADAIFFAPPVLAATIAAVGAF